MSRERLVHRIEIEARAYVNAKGSNRDADSAGELVADRYRVYRIRVVGSVRT